MLAFLAISGYVYIDSTKEKDDRFYLNLIDRHIKENTYYYLERTAGGAGTGQKKLKCNRLNEIKALCGGKENG